MYIKYMRDENRKKRIDQQKNYYHDFSRLNQIIIEKYNLKINLVFEPPQISEIDYMRTSELKVALENDFKTIYEDLTLVLFDYEDIITFVEKTSSTIINDLRNLKIR